MNDKTSNAVKSIVALIGYNDNRRTLRPQFPYVCLSLSICWVRLHGNTYDRDEILHEREGAMRDLGSLEPLRMDVRDFLEFQCSLERHWVVDAASAKERV